MATSAKVAAGSDVVLLNDGSAVFDPLTHALGELVKLCFPDSWIVLGSTKQVLLRDLPNAGGRSGHFTSGSVGAVSMALALDHLLRLRSVLEHTLWHLGLCAGRGQDAGQPLRKPQWLLGHDVVIRRVAPGHCVQTDCPCLWDRCVLPHLTWRLPAAPPWHRRRSAVWRFLASACWHPGCPEAAKAGACRQAHQRHAPSAERSSGL